MNPLHVRPKRKRYDRANGRMGRAAGPTGAIQSGFSIIAAAFLLVVLAALGTFVLSVSNMQHVGHAYDVQGSRAYQAARAGIEWGLYQALQGPGTCAAATGTFVPGAIPDFAVTVACASSSTDELGTVVTVFALTATACNRPAGGPCPGSAGENYVERQIAATAARSP